MLSTVYHCSFPLTPFQQAHSLIGSPELQPRRVQPRRILEEQRHRGAENLCCVASFSWRGSFASKPLLSCFSWSGSFASETILQSSLCRSVLICVAVSTNPCIEAPNPSWCNIKPKTPTLEAYKAPRPPPAHNICRLCPKIEPDRTLWPDKLLFPWASIYIGLYAGFRIN